MEAKELLAIINRGESSKVQFKERLPHIDSLAHELIAFANTQGGLLLIGINDKNGELNGLSFSEIQQSNSQIVNAASQKVFPPIRVITETISVKNQNIIVVKIEEGAGKPYKDRDGVIYVKNGSDKRKVTSNDELARLLREGGVLYAEEMPVNGSSTKDIDIKQFDFFLFKKYKKTLEELQSEKLSIDQMLENLNLAKNGVFLLTGLLLFSTKRQLYYPQFSVQCVSVDGTIIGNTFSDNENTLEGTLSDVFKGAMDFIGRNMKKIPETDSFNSPTKWEIPYEVFEELLMNALVHRDYFISSTVKVYIFSDRVEIISPGKLPNSLTVENIKNGISILRNPTLVSTVQHILPYKGLGTGIVRSYSLYPDITMENKADENRFKVIIQRPRLVFDDIQADKDVPENVLENVPETGNVLENVLENIPETGNVLENVLENVPETGNVPENVLENVLENVPETGNVLENVLENIPETEDVPENVLESRYTAIIDIMKNNVEITMSELSEKLKVTSKTIQRDIQTLKSKGLLKRIGPDKGGYWEIVK